MSSMCGEAARCIGARLVKQGRRLSLTVGALAACSWLVFTPVVDSVRAEVERQPPRHIVTGILSMLDISTGKGMLKTEFDKPIFFEISRPELFNHVSIGDRITIQLDDEGRTMKVIEDLPSELHMPAPEPEP